MRDDELKDIWWEGYHSYFLGEKLSNSPYFGEEEDAWREGWYQASQDD